MPNPNKFFLHEITTPLKTVTSHLQDHQFYSETAMNINPDLNSEYASKPNRFQNINNYITKISDTAPVPITRGPGAKSTLVALSDTPEESPTVISTSPYDMPLEAPTQVPNY